VAEILAGFKAAHVREPILRLNSINIGKSSGVGIFVRKAIFARLLARSPLESTYA
jgi:hypothetical protein